MFDIIDAVIPEPIMVPLESEAVPTQVPDIDDVGEVWAAAGVELGPKGIEDEPPLQPTAATAQATAVACNKRIV